MTEPIEADSAAAPRAATEADHASSGLPASPATPAPPAAASLVGSGGASLLARLRRLLPLVLMFVGWYVGSFYTDYYNKQIQKVIPVPATLTLLQVVAGGLVTGIMLRSFRVTPFIPLRKDQLGPVLPVAACWTIGLLTTNFSLGATSVSFTQAVKATEPLFLVIIATVFFRRRYSPGVWISLLPLAVGIAMVSMSDLSFTVTGFLSAAVANCCFATRSLVVKDVLARGLLDNLNLFYYISWLSAAAVLVFSVPLELQILRTHWHLIDRHLVGLALVHGFLHYFYNQMSMVILSHVAALTHSVSNAARRFFIIMVNVMLYGHRLTHGNQFGLVVVLLGASAYAYSEARNMPGKPVKAAEARKLPNVKAAAAVPPSAVTATAKKA